MKKLITILLILATLIPAGWALADGDIDPAILGYWTLKEQTVYGETARLEDILAEGETFPGMAFEPDGRVTISSPWIDDTVYAFTAANGVFSLDGEPGTYTVKGGTLTIALADWTYVLERTGGTDGIFSGIADPGLTGAWKVGRVSLNGGETFMSFREYSAGGDYLFDFTADGRLSRKTVGLDGTVYYTMNGTWTAEGSSLTLVTDDGYAEECEYAVRGSEVWITLNGKVIVLVPNAD